MKNSLIDRHGVNEVLDNVRLERREKILEWLSIGDFSMRHHELQKTRVKNSGRWFLESKEFMNWVNGSGPNCLICSGIRLPPFNMQANYASGSREINSHVQSIVILMLTLGLLPSIISTTNLLMRTQRSSIYISITRLSKLKRKNMSPEISSNKYYVS